MRKIIHIDMDCFYAAIEMRDNPALVDKPIAVGGQPSERSVLCTSNYVARKFGVRSAMASSYAKKLCPELIILPVDMAKYKKISAEIKEIFYQYTDLVEPLSLDEAFLDVSEVERCENSATLMATEIRQKIWQRCRLTASAGVAPNKFLAKVASDLKKPNGQYVIPPHKIESFIQALPVNKIFGVGKVTRKKMHALGLYTCQDLQARTLEELVEIFGKFGQRLYEVCRGIDDRPVVPSRIAKSVSVEHTYSEDLQNILQCLDQLPALFDSLINRLDKHQSKAIHKQFIKIKFFDFTLTSVETVVTELSLETFSELVSIGFQRRQAPVRLLGIGVGFKEAGEEVAVQGELFP